MVSYTRYFDLQTMLVAQEAYPGIRYIKARVLYPARDFPVLVAYRRNIEIKEPGSD